MRLPWLIALATLVVACKSGDAGHEGHAPAAPSAAASSSASGLEGYVPFEIDPTKQGGMTITTSAVQERHFIRTVRTTGIVAVDETRTSHVHTKVRATIESTNVDFIGKQVRQGEALCSLYSQEVYAAELEFLTILDRMNNAPKITGEFAQSETDAQNRLLAAARRRLSLWDVPPSEVTRLETSKEARRTFPLLATRSGVVIARQAYTGAFVDPSVELYTISDLSNVWVLTDVYEADVPSVHVGQPASITLQGETAPIAANVSFLPPTIDTATRTLKVRFDLPNKDGRIRPGAFADVAMELHVGMGLGIPESAVIRTGTRAVVFVVHGNHVEPREVKLGILVDDYYQVLSGVVAGENVATSAQFLLDSESRLQASQKGTDAGTTGGGHAGHVR